MCGRNTRTGGTNVEGLGEFDELDSGGVDAAKKNRYLEADAGGATALGGVQALTSLIDLKFQGSPMVPAN